VSTEIVVNSENLETRAAVLEDGKLVEVHYERNVSRRLAGNIYLGKVVRVLPGMQAAFVDIGLDKNAFLYIDDISESACDSGGIGESERCGSDRMRAKSISRLVASGQQLLVQVAKEPTGTKGARVTTNVTLPGRYIVLMPTADHVGVSRRIESEDERSRLRGMALSLDRRGMGMIVRTAAEGVSEEDLQGDFDFLVSVWEKICSKSKRSDAPALMHREYDLVYRLIRDFVDESVNRLIIDSADEYRRAVDLVSTVMPWFRDRVQHYLGKTPILQHYGVEPQLSRAFSRKVWLDCG